MNNRQFLPALRRSFLGTFGDRLTRYARMKLKPIAMSCLLLSFVAAWVAAQAPRPDEKTLAATGILERLAERSGVYAVPATAAVPGFVADAGWPQKLPN